MRLEAIKQSDFHIWKTMRERLYGSFKGSSNEIEMEQIYANDHWYCRFIMDDKGNISGFIEWSLRNIVDACLSSPVVYLEGLYLKAEYRGQGLGKEVMTFLMAWCIEHGYTELATDTELANIRAQKFYRMLGFEETDRVVEFRIRLDQGT